MPSRPHRSSAVRLRTPLDRRTYQTTIPTRSEMFNIIRTAFDRGVTFFDAAEAYGPHEVERILLRPGANVQPQTVILELSNPQLQQDVKEAQLGYQSAQAAFQNRKAELVNNGHDPPLVNAAPPLRVVPGVGDDAVTIRLQFAEMAFSRGSPIDAPPGNLSGRANVPTVESLRSASRAGGSVSASIPRVCWIWNRAKFDFFSL